MEDITIEILGYKESFSDSGLIKNINSKFIEGLYEEMEDKDIDEDVFFFVESEALEEGVDLPDPDAEYYLMLSIDDETVCGGLAYDQDDVDELIEDFVGATSDILLGEYEMIDSRNNKLDDLSLEELKELNDSLGIGYPPESEGFNLTSEEYNNLGPLSRKIYDYLAEDLLEESDDTYLETFDTEPKEEPKSKKNQDRVEKLNYIVDVYNELGSLIEDYIAEENLDE